METTVLPARTEPCPELAARELTEPADAPLPRPSLTVVTGGGDTTDVRAALHAVSRAG
jgi:hypothetical protein